MFYFFCERDSAIILSPRKINEKRCIGCQENCIFADLFNMIQGDLSIDLLEWLEKCPIEKVCKRTGLRIIPKIEKKVLNIDLYEKLSKMNEENIRQLISEWSVMNNKFAEKFSEMEDMLIKKFAEK